MTGSVELDADGAHLLIRFPYREDLVAMVKDLPGRRWDPQQRLWRVPAANVQQVYLACSRHLFEFAPEVTSLLAGTRGSSMAPARTPDASPPALSVSALNAAVRDALRRRFPNPIWVVGEIVGFDKGAARQHRFFQLVEKAHGEARAFAVVEAALFGDDAARLLPALLAHDPPLELRDGLEVRVLVRVDLFGMTGRYQVVVQDIDPDFTLGKLLLSKAQILRELERLGLASRNRELPLPTPALRVGVLTSPDADGWNDFLRHVEEAAVGLDLALLPIKVQGRELRPSLLAGLAWFAAHSREFDLLCIVRGGGSRTDLAWFDDRELALAVARHPLKIVVGIGHQRDQSVLDAIAHSEKTPTAVAELLVRGVQAARQEVREQARRLGTAVLHRLDAAAREHSALARRLHHACDRRLARLEADFAAAGQTLGAAARFHLQRQTDGLSQMGRRLGGAAARRLDLAAADIERAATSLRLLDPAQVLARGFAIVTTAAGRIRTSAAGLAAADLVRIRWRDGAADARIEQIHEAP